MVDFLMNKNEEALVFPSLSERLSVKTFMIWISLSPQSQSMIISEDFAHCQRQWRFPWKIWLWNRPIQAVGRYLFLPKMEQLRLTRGEIMRAIIALAVLVGCAETETTEETTDNTTETTEVETTNTTTDENTTGENTTPATPAKTTDVANTSNSSESAVSSD